MFVIVQLRQPLFQFENKIYDVLNGVLVRGRFRRRGTKSESKGLLCAKQIECIFRFPIYLMLHTWMASQGMKNINSISIKKNAVLWKLSWKARYADDEFFSGPYPSGTLFRNFIEKRFHPIWVAFHLLPHCAAPQLCPGVGWLKLYQVIWQRGEWGRVDQAIG